MNEHSIFFRIKRKIFSIISPFLYRSIIVRMDGGICSQIAFYALGKALGDTSCRGDNKSQGDSKSCEYNKSRICKAKCCTKSHILYDTTWFDTNGTDLTGNFSRSFQLKRAFPSISFKSATQKKIAFYKEHFVSNSINVASFAAPLYLGLYYRCEPYVFRYREFFRAHLLPDNLAFSKENATVLRRIQAAPHSCCVHVRRGDLSSYLADYGEPATIGYFEKAIAFITEQNPDTYFFVFSDEAEWTKANIMPIFEKTALHSSYAHRTSVAAQTQAAQKQTEDSQQVQAIPAQNALRQNTKHSAELVDINNADSGYIDLYLMAQCRDCIASQGSFGVYAYVLSAMDGVLVVPQSVTEEKRALYRQFFPTLKEI